MAKNPFKEDRDREPNSFWFFKSAVKASILAGAGVIAWKFKGPAGNLLDKIKQSFIEREIAKSYDISPKMTDILNNITVSNSLNLEEFNRVKGYNAELVEDRIRVDHMSTSDQVINSIGRAEDDFANSTILGSETIIQRFQVGNDSPTNLLYAKLRLDTLKWYISEEGTSFINDSAIRDQSGLAKEVFTLGENLTDPANVKRLAEIHESYLRGSPTYASKYKNSLNKLRVNYTQTHRARNVSLQAMSPNEFREFIHTGAFGTTYSDIESQLHVGSIVLGGKRVQLGGPQETRNILDILDNWNGRDKVFKSGADGILHTGLETNYDLFKMVQNYDYTVDMKRIADSLHKLEDQNLIESANFKLEIYGKGTDKKHWAIIEFIKNKKTYQIPIPLTVNGRLPGANEGVSDYLDGNFQIGSPFKAERDPVKVNMTHINLRLIDKMLNDTNLNVLRDRPQDFVQAAVRGIQNRLQVLPRARNQIRDAANILAVYDPAMSALVFGASHHTKNQFIYGIESAQTLRKVARDPKALILTIDLETLTPQKDIGAQHAAFDPFTEVHGAGFLLTDPHNNNFALDADELVTTHFFEDFPFTDYHKNWFSRILHISDPEVALKTFKEQVKKKEIAQKVSYKSTHDFIDAIFNKIEEYGNKNPGKQIYINTKNGSIFDLQILKKYDLDRWNKLVAKGRVIDVHSITYLQNFGTYSSQSLSLGSLMKTLLGRGDEYDIDSPDFKIDKLLEALGRKNRGAFLKGREGALFSHAKDFLAVHGKKLVGAHSALTDTIPTAALLQLELYKLMSGDDDFYDNLDRYGHIVSLGKKAKNPGELLQYFSRNEGVMDPDFKVPSSFGYTSDGMKARGQYSLLQLMAMVGYGDVPVNKQWNQLDAGVRLTASEVFNQQIKKFTASGDWAKVRRLKRIFKPYVATDAYLAAEQFVTKADSFANLSSHKMLANTFHDFGSLLGREGYIGVTKQYLDNISAGITTHTEILNETQWMERGTVINFKIRDLIDKITKKATEMARTNSNGSDIRSDDHWAEAARQVIEDNKDDLWIPENASLELARGDKGSASTSPMKIVGRISNVRVVTDMYNRRKGAAPRLQVELSYFTKGADIVNTGGVLRSMTSKASFHVLGAISDSLAYNIESIVNADMLDKGYVGSIKSILVNKLLSKCEEVLIDPSSSARDKDKYRGIMEKIRVKLNAEYTNGQMKINTQKRNTNTLFREPMNEADLNAVYQYLGNVDISLNDIMGWFKQADIVFKKKNIELYHNFVQGLGGVESYNKNVKLIFDKAREKVLKGTMSGMDALQFLTEKGRSIVANELSVYESMVRMPSEGDPLIFEAIPDPSIDNISNKFLRWGIFAPSEFDLYNIEGNISNHRNRFKIKRNEIMVAFHGGNMTKSTREVLKKEYEFMKSTKHHDVRRAQALFSETLLARKVAQGPLNLAEIENIVNRQQTLDMAKEGHRIMDDSYLERVRETVKNQLDTLDVLSDPDAAAALEGTIESINELIAEKKGNVLESLKENKRLFHVLDLNQWASINQSKGVVTLDPSLAGKSGALKNGVGEFKFKLRAMVDEISEQFGKNSDELYQGLYNIFEESQKNAKVNNFVPNLEIDPDTGIATIRQFHLPAYGRPGTIGNKLSDSYALVSSEMRLHYDVLNAFKMMYDLANDPKNVDNGVLQKSKHELLRHYIMTLALPSVGKNSTLHEAGEISLPGVYEKTTTTDSLRHTILSKKIGGYQGINKADAAFLDNMLDASAWTVFVSENFYNKLTVNSPDGPITFARHLENVLGKEKAETYRSGKAAFSALYTRNPAAQSGTRALSSVAAMVIPDRIRELIGMPDHLKASFVLSSLDHNADNDGDHAILAALQLSVADPKNGDAEMVKRMEEMDDLYKARLQTREGKEVLLKQSPIPLFYGEDVIIDRLNDKGQHVQERIPISEFSDPVRFAELTKFDNIAETLTKAAANHPNVITGSYAKAQINQAAVAGVSKQLIGIVTNIATRMTANLARVGVNTESVEGARLIGTLNFGLANMAQQPINIGKRPVEQDIARVSSFLEYFRNTGKANERDKAVVKEMSDSAYLSAGFTQEEADASFSLLSGTRDVINNIERLSYKLKYATKAMMSNFVGSPDHNLVTELQNDLAVSFDYNLNEIITNSLLEQQKAFDPDIVGNFGKALSTKFKLNEAFGRPIVRKSGKVAAMLGAGYLALNFFRPSQLSNSMNPLDMFTDLGTDIDGQNNRISSRLELERSIPLDMVDASFSKQAYVKTSNGGSSNKKAQGDIMQAMLSSSFFNMDSAYYQYRESPNISRANYTTGVGYLASADMMRRYR